MISRTMVMVSTLISKLEDVTVGNLARYLERQANDPNPFAVELATQRIIELKRVLKEGGTCPYTDQFVPKPVDS